MGYGPYRVWKNRIRVLFGVWDKKYNNTETGEYPWYILSSKDIMPVLQGKFYYKENRFTVVAARDLFLCGYLHLPGKPINGTIMSHFFLSAIFRYAGHQRHVAQNPRRNETTGPMGNEKCLLRL